MNAPGKRTRLHPRSGGAADGPVGWSTRSAQAANAGFGQVQNAHLYEGESPSVKAKLVTLISAIRTLMRSESSIPRSADTYVLASADGQYR